MRCFIFIASIVYSDIPDGKLMKGISNHKLMGIGMTVLRKQMGLRLDILQMIVDEEQLQLEEIITVYS